MEPLVRRTVTPNIRLCGQIKSAEPHVLIYLQGNPPMNPDEPPTFVATHQTNPVEPDLHVRNHYRRGYFSNRAIPRQRKTPSSTKKKYQTERVSQRENTTPSGKRVVKNRR